MDVSQSHSEFSKWRSILWPIHNYEHKKFIPLTLMFFCFLFNYTILRYLKESLLITAPNSGAESTQFIKTVGVAPAAILFLVLYTKGINRFEKEKLFYVTIIPFLVFFALFSTVLFPLKDVLQPSHAHISELQTNYPNFKWIFSLYGNWTYSLFYIMAEMWGSVTVSLLFWQFANEITQTEQAKRFYGTLNIIAGSAGIFAGHAIQKLGSMDQNNLVTPIKWLMGIIILSGLIGCFLYRWMNLYILTDTVHYTPVKKSTKISRPKMGLIESFKFILTSPYLGLIAMIIIASNLSLNLIEGYWKDQVRIQYPNMSENLAFMGKYAKINSVCTIIMTVIASNLVRMLSWKNAAIIAPVFFLVTGVPFFVFILFKDSFSEIISTLGTTPVWIAVLLGTISTALSKGVKYSLTDVTKEIAYIPLDDEIKAKGKAVVDVLGIRFGKSGSSTFQSLFILLTAGNYITIGPYIAAIFCIICILWVLSVIKLSQRYVKLVEYNN